MLSDTEISKKICDYIQKNPHAADTVEGIIHWWLEQKNFTLSLISDNRNNVFLSRVLSVLDQLCDDRVLASKALPQGKIIYFSHPDLSDYFGSNQTRGSFDKM
jgi:hypothetical protein